jgi:dethiobiotin synthetase
VIVALCAGTGTDVGKTWVGAAVLAHLGRRGVSVAARKPAQSFEPGSVTDADVLAAATGERSLAVCLPERWYPVPMAPPMAADVLDRPRFAIKDLVAELIWPDPLPAVGWVESAGGVRSPIADDGDTADLAAALQPDLVVLVADAGLGTIHAVRSSIAALEGLRTVVFLNRFDTGRELHRRNCTWLVERCGFDVSTEIEELAEELSRPVKPTWRWLPSQSGL